MMITAEEIYLNECIAELQRQEMITEFILDDIIQHYGFEHEHTITIATFIENQQYDEVKRLAKLWL